MIMRDKSGKFCRKVGTVIGKVELPVNPVVKRGWKGFNFGMVDAKEGFAILNVLGGARVRVNH